MEYDAWQKRYMSKHAVVGMGRLVLLQRTKEYVS